jgi:hypothetical protein
MTWRGVKVMLIGVDVLRLWKRITKPYQYEREKETSLYIVVLRVKSCGYLEDAVLDLSESNDHRGVLPV